MILFNVIYSKIRIKKSLHLLSLYEQKEKNQLCYDNTGQVKIYCINFDTCSSSLLVRSRVLT